MARDALFDLAINRALSYAQSLHLSLSEGSSLEKDPLEKALSTWHQQTRFAYRIPLKTICQILLSYPGNGHFWQGGEKGSWQRGKAPRP
jgi:hypothetical protein